MSKGIPPRFQSHGACRTLTGLTVEHVPRDGSLGRSRRYRKGADIWHAEDRADRLYFLVRGQVTVMTSDRQGHEVIVRVIGAGEPFGELCFCTAASGRRETIARAVVECEVLEIAYGDFVSYLQERRAALDAFVVTFCVRLSDAERRIEVLSHRGAEDRLGGLLLQLAAARGRPGAGRARGVTLHVSHDELAQMAAMSRSHVTVTMGRMRRRGLVRYDRNHPLVVDVDALRAYLTEEREVPR